MVCRRGVTPLGCCLLSLLATGAEVPCSLGRQASKRGLPRMPGLVTEAVSPEDGLRAPQE